MTIDFNCPHCGQGLSAEKSSAGLEGECSACHQPIIVPNRIPTKESVVQSREEKAEVAKTVAQMGAGCVGLIVMAALIIFTFVWIYLFWF